MKTLLFCCADIPDESAWQQRYLPWLAHHRGSLLAADAIVMFDDHSPFAPALMPTLPAGRIGHEALPSEALIRFAQRLGRPKDSDCPAWWRAMFASVCVALHYGFERIVHVEYDTFILSERLARYLAERSSGWTALWHFESDAADPSIQVLCRDAFDRVEALAAGGPFAFYGVTPASVLPFSSIEKKFTAKRGHEPGQPIPLEADYVTNRDGGAWWPVPTLAAPSGRPLLAIPCAAASPDQLAAASTEQQLHALSLAFPYDATTLGRYGIAAYQNGNLAAARAALERADWLQPEVPLTTKFLGAARMQQGDLAGAVSAATLSARLNPGDADAMNMAGAFSLEAGQVLVAIDYLRAALALAPEASASLANLARIDWNASEVEAKFPEGLRGIELEVRGALMERLRSNTLTARGAAALMAFGVHDPQGFELLVQLARALTKDEQSDAQTLFSAGNALIVAGDDEAALAAYQSAARLAPQSDRIRAAVGYASICQGGDLFQEGFRIANEAWPRINPAAFMARPKRWNGDVHETTRLLVYQEQGIGDALICLRLLPLIKNSSIDARLWLRPELAALVANQTGLPLLASSERPDAVELGFDSVISLFGLIDALDITADRIPRPLTIQAPAESVLLFARKLAPLKRLRAGLCLFGNPNRSDDWARSVALQDIAALTQLQQVDWINLSVDARPEREGLKELLPGLVDVTADMKDFKATAALIANLDVVISIDTVIAHLAAALGKPVLLLCPTIADWRWKIGQVDSPWWPTVEVFKSAEAGNFALAMHAVARRIDALAASHR